MMHNEIYEIILSDMFVSHISCRAVGCIFGELLNNSPLFPVNIIHFAVRVLIIIMLLRVKVILISCVVCSEC